MKYLFLDSYAFLSPSTLASALFDMTKNKADLEKLLSFLPDTCINSGEVKRCGMEAEFIRLCYKIDKDTITKNELDAICEKLAVSEKTKEKLLRYVCVLAEAKSIDPKEALFDTKTATDSLVFLAYILETVFSLNAEKVYASKILIPSDDMNLHNFSEKISNSTYIFKKHNITTAASQFQAPSFSEEWAAMCAVLDISQKSSNTGNIIKIGYGAGEDDIYEVPNILRAVYGEEDGDILFEAESAISLNFEYA